MKQHLVLLALSAAAAGCQDAEPPPVVATVPDFELTDQAGGTFHAAALDGKVTIVDFIFTSCPTQCPMLTATMGNLARRFTSERDLRFLSVSVDPEHDTPEVLRAYAERHGVDLSRWTFVTGERPAVARVVVDGFKVGLGDRTAPPAGGPYDIPHSRHFVLVDRERRIRGYYTPDRAGMDRLAEEVRVVLDEEAR